MRNCQNGVFWIVLRRILFSKKKKNSLCKGFLVFSANFSSLSIYILLFKNLFEIKAKQI